MTVKNSVKRLLQYRLFVLRLQELGFDNVFSHHIAKEVGVSPEQVRKDFSLYGIKGYKKAGYNINNALEVFNESFGRTEIRNIIVMGMGYLGRAMVLNNKSFISNKFRIVAAFDINPAKRKKFFSIPVYSPDELQSIINLHKVKTAILTVPIISAQIVCNSLVQEGINGIMSFAPVVLTVPEHVAVNYVNLCNELEATSFTALTKSKLKY